MFDIALHSAPADLVALLASPPSGEMSAACRVTEGSTRLSSKRDTSVTVTAVIGHILLLLKTSEFYFEFCVTAKVLGKIGLLKEQISSCHGKFFQCFKIKKSWIIGLIPIVHIAVLAFRMFAFRYDDPQDKRRFPYEYLLIIPAALLYRFLPEGFGWLITYLLISGIACITLFRDSGKGEYVVDKRFWINVGVLGGIAAIFIGAIFSTLNEKNLQPAKEAISACIVGDEDTWMKVIHPEYSDELGDLEKIRDQADIGECSIEEIKTNISFSSHINGKNRFNEYSFTVKTNKKTYLVTTTYLSNPAGKGICEINIECD